MKSSGIAGLLKPYKKQLIIGPAFKLFEAVLELLIPGIMVLVIDKGVAEGDRKYIITMCILMAVIALAGFASALVCQYMASVTSQGFGTALRNKLFEHVNCLSPEDLDRFGTSTLVNRITNDINILQQSVAMFIRLVIRAPFICIGSLVMAMMIDLRLSVVILVALPLLCFLIFIIMKKTVPWFKKVQEKLDRIALSTGENMMGVRVIRGFDRQKGEEEKFGHLSEEYKRDAVKASRLSMLLSPVATMVMNFAILAVLGVGNISLRRGDISSGEIIAFINYITYMVTALLVVANLVSLYTKAWASLARVREVLDVEEADKNTKAVKGWPSSSINNKIIEFHNVTFGYNTEAEPVLEGISFSIEEGETVGLIGGTGSGKTTLANLILKMYIPQKGSIRIKGADIMTISTKSLRENIGVASQQVQLFSGTIEENIRMGRKDATAKEVQQAAETAQISDFIEKLPDKYMSVVERDGANFSGGQKQRLNIARALIRQPQMLILDDTTSALDNVTEGALREAIIAKAQVGCMLIISQRPECVKHCDKIIVLDDGRIDDIGNHTELYARCNIYRDLCKLSEDQGG